MRVFVSVIPTLRAALFDKRHVGRQECAADILGQFEILFPVAGIVVVHKDAANPTRATPVRDKEILVGPFLEFRVVVFPMWIKVLFLRRVEMRSIFGVFDARVQV